MTTKLKLLCCLPFAGGQGGPALLGGGAPKLLKGLPKLPDYGSKSSSKKDK